MTPTHHIGTSKAFTALREDIGIVAPLDCSVLLQGETGTGKEVVARSIHEQGPRRHQPFVAVNCAAIPAALLESELFGHEKGAFTGAIAQTLGRFHTAHRGTLFLDEIGDLPLELQPKLLRVLQEQQVERVGSLRATRIDVRIIAATNADLPAMVQDKRFRADLYYRLNVFPIQLAPLRERRDDITPLALHFLHRSNERLGRHVRILPDNLLAAMHAYTWPGNIRELQNFIERAVITSTGDILTPREGELEQLSLRHRDPEPLTLADAERVHIERALAASNWVISGRGGAAARLGLPRTTLIYRMQRLNITRPAHTLADARDLVRQPLSGNLLADSCA